LPASTIGRPPICVPAPVRAAKLLKLVRASSVVLSPSRLRRSINDRFAALSIGMTGGGVVWVAARAGSPISPWKTAVPSRKVAGAAMIGTGRVAMICLLKDKS
jgi:hypothetical protein